jgi:hypothetical protein
VKAISTERWSELRAPGESVYAKSKQVLRCGSVWGCYKIRSPALFHRSSDRSPVPAESRGSVSSVLVRRAVSIWVGFATLGGAERAARSGSRGNSQISVSKTGTISALAVGPGREHALACGMSFGIDPLLRRSLYRIMPLQSPIVNDKGRCHSHLISR